MYDVLVKSSLFGFRNADKVLNTNDKGRIFADIGQFTNATKAAAQLDNVVGKGAQAGIEAMQALAKNNKTLETIGKAVNWSAKNVNPLLIGAAGYRVLTAEDKETALKQEIFGMSAMFATENAIKVLYRAKIEKLIDKLPNSKAKIAAKIAEGLFFVMGSIVGSTVGYKIGKYFFPNKEKKENNLIMNIEKLNNSIENNKTNTTLKTPTTNKEEIDNSEYFAITGNKKALA